MTDRRPVDFTAAAVVAIAAGITLGPRIVAALADTADYLVSLI